MTRMGLVHADARGDPWAREGRGVHPVQVALALALEPQWHGRRGPGPAGGLHLVHCMVVHGGVVGTASRAPLLLLAPVHWLAMVPPWRGQVLRAGRVPAHWGHPFV